jgi:hypothetical protein
MRIVPKVALTLAALSFAPAPAAALSAPRVWFAAGGGLAWPPAELGFGDSDRGIHGWQAMGGAVAGYRLLPNLGLEGRVSLVSEPALESLDLLHGEGSLTYFALPTRRIDPFVTMGIGGVRAGRDSGADNTFAWSAGGGFLLRATNRLGLRIDARRISYRVSFFGEKAFRPHADLFAGLHFGFGGAPEARGEAQAAP